MTCIALLPHLWIGTTLTNNFINDQNITAVVAINSNQHINTEIKLYNVNVANLRDFQQSLNPVTSHIHQWLEFQDSVYLYAPPSISGVAEGLACAYLIRYGHMTTKDSIQALLSHNPDIEPSLEHFKATLQAYETSLSQLPQHLQVQIPNISAGCGRLLRPQIHPQPYQQLNRVSNNQRL
jgi:hypothetical protein